MIHFLVLNVTAPAQELKPQGIEFHPTPENIPEVTDPQFTMRAEPKIKFMYAADYETITIGVEEGENHEMFGAINDVAVLGNGTLLELDREYSEVCVIGIDGSFIGTFGKL